MKLVVENIKSKSIMVRESGSMEIVNGLISNGRIGFIGGSEANVTNFVAKHGLKVGDDLSEKLGTQMGIEIQERVGEPFYNGQEPKRAGKNGNILTKNGQPIYRQTIVKSEDSVYDTLVSHDTVTASVSAVIPLVEAEEM